MGRFPLHKSPVESDSWPPYQQTPKGMILQNITDIYESINLTTNNSMNLNYPYFPASLALKFAKFLEGPMGLGALKQGIFWGVVHPCRTFGSLASRPKVHNKYLGITQAHLKKLEMYGNVTKSVSSGPDAFQVWRKLWEDWGLGFKKGALFGLDAFWKLWTCSWPFVLGLRQSECANGQCGSKGGWVGEEMIPHLCQEWRGVRMLIFLVVATPLHSMLMLL